MNAFNFPWSFYLPSAKIPHKLCLDFNDFLAFGLLGRGWQLSRSGGGSGGGGGGVSGGGGSGVGDVRFGGSGRKRETGFGNDGSGLVAVVALLMIVVAMVNLGAVSSFKAGSLIKAACFVRMV